MGHKNYSKFSERFKKSENKEEIIAPVYEEEVIKVVDEYATEVEQEEKVEEIKEPVLAIGVVTGCEKLNVRENPIVGAKILCVLDGSAEVKIDTAVNVPGFYKVITASGVEGYCMAKYILVK